MPRGRKLVKVVEVEECTLEATAEEFYHHMTAKGLAESTIVAPGTYRVYIEVMVTGYDGLFDSVEVGTATFTINT